MAAHHCERCKVYWPAPVVRPSGHLMQPGALCPLCGQRTALLHGATAIDVSQAKHRIFEHKYELREKARKGPSPEEEESAALKAQLDEIRALEEAA